MSAAETRPFFETFGLYRQLTKQLWSDQGRALK